MTRTFRKTIKDHAGPGCDVVREFTVHLEPGNGHVTQRDDGQTVYASTESVEECKRWLRLLPATGFEEVIICKQPVK